MSTMVWLLINSKLKQLAPYNQHIVIFYIFYLTDNLHHLLYLCCEPQCGGWFYGRGWQQCSLGLCGHHWCHRRCHSSGSPKWTKRELSLFGQRRALAGSIPPYIMAHLWSSIVYYLSSIVKQIVYINYFIHILNNCTCIL